MESSFLKSQQLDIEDNGKVVLTNSFNTDELDEQLKKERENESTNGKMVMHKVCSIPEFEFQIDPLLKKYQMLCEMGDGTEARKVLKNFLALNPQYLATSKRF
jgi:hypothetical protein